MNYSGQFLATSKNNLINRKFRIQKLDQVFEYNQKYKAILIPSLHSDFSLIISSVTICITCSGSLLSHLAIVAREQGIPVFLIKDLLSWSSLPATNQLTILSDRQIAIHEL